MPRLRVVGAAAASVLPQRHRQPQPSLVRRQPPLQQQQPADLAPATDVEVDASPSSDITTAQRELLANWPRYTPDEFLGRTGAEIVRVMLERFGVTHLFGYPGGTVLPVFDAIYSSEQLRLITPAHEQGGGHMAEGYARAYRCGRVGVALVTSGPGATNTVTPLADAFSDGIPLVVLCGQVCVCVK